jgi:phosphopantothenoylcysteine synthetase/decarboxylase
MTHSENPRVLYVVACAAPAASTVQTFVSLAKEQGWRVFVVGTPDARSFLDAPAVEAVTGDPIRVGYRMPGEPKALPLADAVVVAPATFNTINKWAMGVADNFAVALLCELTGFRVPTLAVPLLKDALARHPAFPRNLDTLRAMGVKVLFDPSAPREQRMPCWDRVLAELKTMIDDRSTGGEEHGHA